MLPQKSIRNNFILQLVSASATLIVIFSVILYNYIKISVLEDLTEELTQQAATIATSRTSALERMGINILDPFFSSSPTPTNNVHVSVAIRIHQGNTISFEQSEEKEKKFLTIYYPIETKKHHFISIKKDISNTFVLLSKILKYILIINFFT